MVSVLRDSIEIIDCESEYEAVSKSDAIVVILDFACGFTLVTQINFLDMK